MEFIIGISLAVIHAVVTAIIHNYKIRRSSAYNREHGTTHNWSSGVGGAVAKIVFSAAIGFEMAIRHWAPIETSLMLAYFPLGAVFAAGIFWLVFDPVLNWLLGDKLTYVSVTNNKFFDRIFKGNFKKQLAAKLAVIAAGLITLIILF